MSMWGHDFRPDYLFIRRGLEALGDPTILGMTATATPETARDIGQALGRELEVVHTSVVRPNLRYDVQEVANAEDRIEILVERLRALRGGSAIVYSRSRRSTEELARVLRGHGFRAEHYHAGLEPGERTRVQDDFVADRAQVVVATTAFGMGIDKPDVRLVCLVSYPDSLEGYVQMVGRAGRDGEPSQTLLLASPTDAGTLRRFAVADVPSVTELRSVYGALRDGQGLVDPAELSAVVPDRDALNDTLLNDRLPGTFNYPVHKVYYFDATIDQDDDYKVVVVARGETVTATTPVVNDFSISPPDANPGVVMNFIVAGNYTNYDLNWNSGVDGKRWEVSYRVRYSEVHGGDTTQKEFTRSLGTRTAISADASPPEDLNATIGAVDFYQGMANIVNANAEAGVTQRIFHGIDFLFAVASDDFHTYLQLSDPISGIVEERPDFTNVTNGYGLFGSRYFKQVIGKRLGVASTDELVDGQYTGDMHWCVDWPSDHQCP